MHPVRQVRAGLPARRDPRQGLRPAALHGRTATVQVGDRAGRGSIQRSLHAAGRARGLHRLRARASRSARCKSKSGSRAQGDRHGAAGAASRRASAANWDFFLSLPGDRDRGAAARSGEGTPAAAAAVRVLRRVRRLRRDALPQAADASCSATARVIANATGCSSIYGGNLPTTPWTVNASGRGPAWANSLFEDNAEFGLGIRLAIDEQRTRAARRCWRGSRARRRRTLAGATARRGSARRGRHRGAA